MQRTMLVSLALLLCGALHAEPARKRALLVGINDYSASTLPSPTGPPVPPRAWSNLDGAVNDVEILRGLLLARYGFAKDDIVTLTDQQATSAAIREKLKHHLVEPAKKGDTVVFIFSGHGSQVRNTRSSEADKLDESLVPADSRLGQDDIRDKELRRAFNSILDRGAHLTVILDACHSGSGARGLEGGPRHRSIDPDLRDVGDPSEGPRPEDRGALVLAATQDFDLAYETIDGEGNIHGAFSWALARAMKDAEPHESASDTFRRAQAHLRAEAPAQDPILAGRTEARLAPLFGTGAGPRSHCSRLAIESITPNGTYLLRGGWVDGVTVGSELRVAGQDGPKLEVIALRGISSCEARLSDPNARAAAPIRAGALVEVVSWAAPPARPLRVWIPTAENDFTAIARKLRADAIRRGIRWIADPTAETPTHQLRWQNGSWELVTNGRTRKAGATLDDVPSRALLFVQLPVSVRLADAIGEVDGVERARTLETADYVLAGRLEANRVEYAWVHPLVSSPDRARSMLPLRTAWGADGEASLLLRDGLIRLRRVHGWHELASPEAPSHYRLAVRRADDGRLVEGGTIEGKRRYRLSLLAREQTSSTPVYARYIHVFVIDSHGNGVLVFPRPEDGEVENRLPMTVRAAQPLRDLPEEIALGTYTFEVSEPYGIDSYFVLATDEPLPALASLEWDGVRSPAPAQKRSPLEELLAQTLNGRRSGDRTTVRTPVNWSLEKVVFESVAPGRSGP